MVLLAFYRAAKGTTSKVPYEELVLQAWRDFPEAFSLRNHPEHPDASDVHKKLYQSLKKAELVVSLGNKVFRLTEKGVAEAQSLEMRLGTAPAADGTSSGRLSRQEENILSDARKSRPFMAWKAGESDKLIDYDARLFFRFSTSTPSSERVRRVREVITALDRAESLGKPDADQLRLLAEHLKAEFGQLLGISEDAR